MTSSRGSRFYNGATRGGAQMCYSPIIRRIVASGAGGLSKKRVLWSEGVGARVESRPGHFMSRTSIEVRCVSSLTVFLEVATKDCPDLIVIDAASTDMQAASTCTQLRRDDRTRNVPILVLAAPGEEREAVLRAGCTTVIDSDIDPQPLQEQIAAALGIQLRRYPRYPIVLPVGRGRIFHEFLGYSNSLSLGGMGFDTITRIRAGDLHPLRIYRSTEERPIGVVGRICGVRPNSATGLGYTVGVAFNRLSDTDRTRLQDLFPAGSATATPADAAPGAGGSPDPPGR
jgi:CheY-like chemotaxis protein